MKSRLAHGFRRKGDQPFVHSYHLSKLTLLGRVTGIKRSQERSFMASVMSLRFKHPAHRTNIVGYCVCGANLAMFGWSQDVHGDLLHSV